MSQTWDIPTLRSFNDGKPLSTEAKNGSQSPGWCGRAGAWRGRGQDRPAWILRVLENLY